jgi:hypothetical protein
VYFWLWLITSPVCLVFYVLLVAELYRLILEKYRGLETLGRWAMYAATAVSVLISALALLPHITPAMPQSSRVLGYELCPRTRSRFQPGAVYPADAALPQPVPRFR